MSRSQTSIVFMVGGRGAGDAAGGCVFSRCAVQHAPTTAAAADDDNLEKDNVRAAILPGLGGHIGSCLLGSHTLIAD